MVDRKIHAPSAYLARGLENLLIITKETESSLVHWSSCLFAKSVGCFAVPSVLLGELLVEPLFLAKAFCQGVQKEVNYSVERISKLALGICCTPLSILKADGVSYLFLQRAPTQSEIRPFGVEKVYGVKVADGIHYPHSVEDIQNLVLLAKKEQRKITIVGTGFSQGDQTAPLDKNDLVIDLRNLKDVQFVPGSNHNLVKVSAGATWEVVQQIVNKKGKSVIVKQASDVFSVGGSIAINCHGWEHAWGAIASTVESLEVIDATGTLKTISMQSSSIEDRELFRCMFGTLGYFGVIVSATLKLKDNEMYQEKGVKVPIREFDSYYKKNIQNNQKIPLLIGRLSLIDKPLSEVYFNTFEVCYDKHGMRNCFHLLHRRFHF